MAFAQIKQEKQSSLRSYNKECKKANKYKLGQENKATNLGHILRQIKQKEKIILNYINYYGAT